MKSYYFILIIISISLSICVHDDEIMDSFPVENNIMILTDSTFDKALEKYENLFIVFYAPWCGHCIKLLPELENTSKILIQENIILAKVDSTKEIKISRKYKINSYPTLIFFKEKIPIKYIGPRTEKDLVDWAQKKSGMPYTLLTKIDEIEKIKNENRVNVIYFGKDEKDIKIFKKLAIKYDNIPFFIVEEQKLAQNYKVVQKSVVIFKKFDEKRNDIINFDENKLEKFIKKNSEEKILSLTKENINLIFNKNTPALVYFGQKETLSWQRDFKTLEKVAFNLDTNLLFIMTETKDGYGKSIAEKIKLKNSEIPCIMILNVKINIDKYKYTGNYKYDDIINFIQMWDKGLLNKYLLSQKEPKKNNGNVYILVSDTFKREVIENDSDVMVLFYNPINNENMKMLKLYDEVAEKLIVQNPELILAKIDMSQNEIDSFIIRNYPTIKFFPGNKKYNSPIEYRGIRKINEIISFIKKHAFHSVKTDEDDIISEL